MFVWQKYIILKEAFMKHWLKTKISVLVNSSLAKFPRALYWTKFHYFKKLNLSFKRPNSSCCSKRDVFKEFCMPLIGTVKSILLDAFLQVFHIKAELYVKSGAGVEVMRISSLRFDLEKSEYIEYGSLNFIILCISSRVKYLYRLFKLSIFSFTKKGSASCCL